MDFYDEIAAQYDQITGQAERQPLADAFCRHLLARHAPATVLDVACGTGLYALTLARMGLKVVGADLSAGMIDQARRSAAQQALAMDWLVCPMQELASRLQGPFDAVLCMGNSIPHLLEPADLHAALTGFHALLRPGGLAVLQLLNYERILRRGERIVGIDRQGQAEYVRFYDFLDKIVRFNILQILWDPPATARHRLYSTTLRAWTHAELTDAMADSRFTDVRTLTAPEFEPFDPQQSPTVMIVAAR